jgi:hypothetical protein
LNSLIIAPAGFSDHEQYRYFPLEFTAIKLINMGGEISPFYDAYVYIIEYLSKHGPYKVTDEL